MSFPKIKRAELTPLGHFSAPRVLEERRSRAEWSKELAHRLFEVCLALEKADSIINKPIIDAVDEVRVELLKRKEEDEK